MNANKLLLRSILALTVLTCSVLFSSTGAQAQQVGAQQWQEVSPQYWCMIQFTGQQWMNIGGCHVMPAAASQQAAPQTQSVQPSNTGAAEAQQIAVLQQQIAIVNAAIAAQDAERRRRIAEYNATVAASSGTFTLGGGASSALPSAPASSSSGAHVQGGTDTQEYQKYLRNNEWCDKGGAGCETVLATGAMTIADAEKKALAERNAHLDGGRYCTYKDALYCYTSSGRYYRLVGTP